MTETCHKRSFNDGVSAQRKRSGNIQHDGLGIFEIHNEFKFRQADRRACATKGASAPEASQMNIPFLLCAFITTVSAVISLGFSVAAAFNPANEVRNTALYTCARSVALVIVSAVPFLTGSTPWLLAIACSMIIVQICDAAIGVVIKDRMKTFGPAGTALLNLAAVIWLLS
jgi:hypothetical protein